MLMDVRSFCPKNFDCLPNFPRNDCFSLALMTNARRIVITTLQVGRRPFTLTKAAPILLLIPLSISSLRTVGTPFNQPPANGLETMQAPTGPYFAVVPARLLHKEALEGPHRLPQEETIHTCFLLRGSRALYGVPGHMSKIIQRSTIPQSIHAVSLHTEGEFLSQAASIHRPLPLLILVMILLQNSTDGSQVVPWR
jgi:hypothetical protein